MGKHLPNSGRDIQKRGMTVLIKPVYNIDNIDKASEVKQKMFDAALKTLKRRLVQEGVIRDMRRKEYYESKGEVGRRKRKEGERRSRKEREAMLKDW